MDVALDKMKASSIDCSNANYGYLNRIQSSRRLERE